MHGMDVVSAEAASPTLGAEPPLQLLRLRPDVGALSRWITSTRQRALEEDTGYAWHAILRATLGELAPKPFVVLERADGLQLLGYTRASPSALERAIELARLTDTVAARALGCEHADGIELRAMPNTWRGGERLSFEARVAPVVRSRSAQHGRYPEVDAAFHPEFHGDAPGDREGAYARWLAREIERGGAATLLTHRALSYRRVPIVRRTTTAEPGRGQRRTQAGLLPDWHVRGLLEVRDGPTFEALLSRGLGRHRSFGYGCVLVAAAGAWT